MKEKPKNNIFKIILSVLVIALIILSIVFVFISNNKSQDEKKLSYDDLLIQIKEQKIEKIEMTVGSTSLKVKQVGVEEEKNTIVPNMQVFVEFVQNEFINGNKFEFIQLPQNMLLKVAEVLFSLLPTIIIVALFIVIMKMQGLGDKGKVYI